MKTIIIEDNVYCVTNKEFDKINLMQKTMDAEKNIKVRFSLEVDLSDYLTKQSKIYKCYGYISFQFRL
jgi:hypothetical protein